LSAVEGNARLASGSLVEEIERLRGEPGDGDIGIGGATLAGEAAQLGLIDEFRPVVNPVVVGGGIPFYPRCERRLLEPIESRTFGSRVVYLRYRVARKPGRLGRVFAQALNGLLKLRSRSWPGCPGVSGPSCGKHRRGRVFGAWQAVRGCRKAAFAELRLASRSC
jgi:hypothetical protein